MNRGELVLNLFFKSLVSFLYWIFHWDWQTIANISVPITLIGTIWYWRKESKLKFIVRIRTLIKIVKGGTELYKPGIQLNVINSSSEIMFIELLGVSKKINTVTRFYFFILKHMGINKRKFYSFKTKQSKTEYDSENLVKLKSGDNIMYTNIGSDYINTLAIMVIDNKRLTRKMKKGKSIKFFISIKVYDKKIWDTTFLLNSKDKTYTDVKRMAKIIE